VIKTATIVAAMAIGFATASYAQTSTPSSQSPAAEQSRSMGATEGAGATRSTQTTGMNSGGGAARTAPDGANGAPGMAPHTTTGPASGSASEAESPSK
jgi:hypothetical protein